MRRSSLVNAPARSLRLDISRVIIAAVLGATVLAGCAATGDGNTPSGQDGDAGAIDVVASTTVLADLVRQVGGSHVTVSSLVPPGGEVHTFDPTPADIARVADAELVVMNGRGLDAWVADLAAASGSEAPILRLGEDVGGATGDPHLWMDVQNGIRYADRIRDELSRVDAANATSYRDQAKSYTERLTQLDRWAREQIAAIPAERRRVVSFHDALPSFADAYGLEIVGTVVDAPGQDPSAGEIAGLIDEIRASGATALFGEAQFNPELARTIAEEAGITVVTDLYTDSLGDAPADTYEGMIRTDVEKVVEALRA
jgi:ABC-type Zn uptake system ZnuABC Zn-binding protein ZnuA